MNLASRGALLQHVLNLAAPRVLLAHGELIERLQGLDVPSLELVVAVGPRPDLEIGVKLIDFPALVDPARAARPVLDPPVQPWDDCALVFTSGTTGPSKGVRTSYASQRLWADSVIWPEIDVDDRFLVSVPLSHIAGISLAYGMLQRSGAVVLPGGFNGDSTVGRRSTPTSSAASSTSTTFRPRRHAGRADRPPPAAVGRQPRVQGHARGHRAGVA